MGTLVKRDFFRRARCDDFAALFAAFRAEVDDPVGAFDDLEIVLDHDDRIARLDQALEQPDEQRDIVEMQAGGRFVEDEKIAAFAVLELPVRQVPDEFQPLGFAAGKGVQRLAEPQITESDFFEDRERPAERLAFP